MPYASAGVRELWFSASSAARAVAGALHVTVAGDTQHGSSQRDALLRRLAPAA